MNAPEHDLTGKKVAILATDGFEQDELLSPFTALKDAGADVRVVSPSPERKIRAGKMPPGERKLKWICR